MDRDVRKRIIEFLMADDVLIKPEFIDDLNGLENIEGLSTLFHKHMSDDDLKVITPKVASLINDLTISGEKKPTIPEGDVKVLFSYSSKEKKRTVEDFVMYFRARYKKVEQILSQRPELTSLLSISRIKSKKEKDTVAFIGLVSSKQYTKNNNIIMEVEDLTGTIKVIVTQKNPELYEECLDIVDDEVIGFTGFSTSDEVVFANSIYFPDVPMNKELKKSPDDAYAVFISDIHVGSKQFLEKEFLKFIKWLRREYGNQEQRKIASKVKYLFIAGDLVDGVGIYPGQEEDLNINDIYKQYERCAELLKMIPKHIKIIICPGNHDAMRLSEPQPIFYDDFSKALYGISNLVMVSNPGMVNIHANEDFSGFDVMMYHGVSMNYLVREVNSIRSNGGYESSDRIMKFLLTRRHLSPPHNASLHIPDREDDPLVIDRIPDFLLVGDIHYSKVAAYKNVTMICGSCWQSMTDFQIKMGHTNIEPCRVAVVNLQTRNIKIMRFGD